MCVCVSMSKRICLEVVVDGCASFTEYLYMYERTHFVLQYRALKTSCKTNTYYMIYTYVCHLSLGCGVLKNSTAVHANIRTQPFTKNLILFVPAI